MTTNLDQSIYEDYVAECKRQNISICQINPILYKYRAKFLPFDLLLTGIEFLTANDLTSTTDEQGRVRLQSKIRDSLVDKLTALILVYKRNYKNWPRYTLSVWASFHAYLKPKNDDPFNSMIISTHKNPFFPKITPILLLYLRHGYSAQYQQLAPYFSGRTKKRNTFPPEVAGKDLQWEKITENEYRVLVSEPERRQPEERFWNELTNEDCFNDFLRDYLITELKNEFIEQPKPLPKEELPVCQ